jgi:hypothetical protein
VRPGHNPLNPREAVQALSVEERELLPGVMKAYRTRGIEAFRRHLASNPHERAVFAKLLNPVVKEAYRRGLEEAQTWVRSQRPESDVWLIIGDAALTAATAEERLAAARRIIAKVSRYFADPAARQRIAEEKSSRGSRETKRWLIEEVLIPAVFMALESIDRPRQIRLREHWLDGKRSATKPSEAFTLEDGNFLRWLKQEVKNAAEALLVEQPYLSSMVSSRARVDPKLIDELKRRLKQPNFHVTPRQRELLNHLCRGVPQNQLPALLGCKPATCRVMFHQIKKKFRET